MCGENCNAFDLVRLHKGSSPRVRGKPFELKRRGVFLRLIPAYAGKTFPRARRLIVSRAHPRVCGENSSSARKASVIVGSSPRVRGKLGDTVAVFVDPGLIPARAGKTFQRPTRQKQCRAHPRVCGENRRVDERRVGGFGSSPRVRGKPGRCFASCSHERLIPACAGKTVVYLSYATMARAHPRVCGENIVLSCLLRLHHGSSPRVRGKPVHVADLLNHRGLIPACAGKTSAVM